MIAAARCTLSDEMSHRRRLQDSGRGEDRKAKAETSAGDWRTNSLEASSRPRAAIWTPTLNYGETQEALFQ